MSVWNKLDSGLSTLYSEFLRKPRKTTESLEAMEAPQPADRDDRIRLSLQYTGDLASIEAAGFETVWSGEPGHATGIVRFADLDAVAAHPGVLQLSFGTPPEPSLDISVPDVRANSVWTRTGSTFDDKAGQDVVIGVLDTGIDVRHPFFRGTGDTTRILAIWDHGLVPEGGEHSPAASLLSGEAGAGKTYGVEYEQAAIAAHDVRHRDCNGHGTHVASIAAGDGRDAYTYVGVAPRADLIVVKLLYPETAPRIDGILVDWSVRLHDAITYVMEKAAELGKTRVVLNCSFGNTMDPHDGFTDDEDWINHKFASLPGKVLVSSAGNAGGKRSHARLEMSPGDEVEIPLRLIDGRTEKQRFNLCRWEEERREFSIKLYYPAGPDITAALKLPGEASFLPPQAHGAPAASAEFASGRRWSIVHKDEPQILRGGRGTIQRKVVEIRIAPNAAKEHRTGTYTVKVSAAHAVVVHLWCNQAQWNFGLSIQAAAFPPWTHVEDKYLISDKGAEHMVTVAAYDAEAAGNADSVTSFSSRGPLVTYGPLPGGVTQPVKPDLSAPGKAIDAARSRDVQPKAKKQGTQALQGTSMAAPHVSGAVALMLQKDGSLTVAHVLQKLQAQRTIAGGESVDDYGRSRLDVKAVWDTV